MEKCPTAANRKQDPKRILAYEYGDDKKAPPPEKNASGDSAPATMTKPAAGESRSAKNPCCGKPHIAFGKCSGKEPFQPKYCPEHISATANY